MERGMKKVVTFCRLRNAKQRNYTKLWQPNQPTDSFFYLYDNFVKTNQQNYDFRWYNFNYVGRNVPRSSVDLKDTDVLVITTDSEFAYNIESRVDGYKMKRTWNYVEDVRVQFREDGKPRHIILLKSDRADTVELFQKNVFNEFDFTYSVIDESDFRAGVHHVRQTIIDKHLGGHKPDKIYDFAYWGTTKRFIYSYTSEQVMYDIMDRGLVRKQQPLYKKKLSEDFRYEILKKTNRSDLKTFWIGFFDGFKQDVKFTHLMGSKVIPEVQKARVSLCFNWPDFDDILTARYNECVVCDVIPLVWRKYDVNCMLVANDYQRVDTFEGLYAKCIELRDDSLRLELLEEIKEKYYEVAGGLEYYHETFNSMMETQIENNANWSKPKKITLEDFLA